MTETTSTALGIGECLLGFHRLENDLAEAGDHHLGDALPMADLERFLREVHQQHLNFPAVVGVNGAGRVEHRDTVFESQAAARTDLRLTVGRQLHIQARGHKHAASGLQQDALRQIRTQVHTRRLLRRIRRQLVDGFVIDSANTVVHRFEILKLQKYGFF